MLTARELLGLVVYFYAGVCFGTMVSHYIVRWFNNRYPHRT